MQGSIQEKLTQVRPPRVRITYDVETGGALEKKELPFIVGILSELTGDFLPAALPPLRERKLVEIDKDNFNQVLRSITPQVKLADLDNVLPGGSGKLSGTLSFAQLDDFSPVAVIQQVAAMKGLYDGRARIRFLQSKSEIIAPLAQYLEMLVATGADSAAARDELKALYQGKAQAEWGKVAPAAGSTIGKLLGPAPAGFAPSAADRATILELLGQFYTDVAGPVGQVRDQIGKLQAAAKGNDKLAAFLEALVTGDGAARAELVASFDAQKGPAEWGAVTPKAGGELEKLLGANGLNLVDPAKASEKKALLEQLGQLTKSALVSLPADNKRSAVALTSALLQKGAAGLIDERVADVDRALGRQLDVIMHAPSFQQLEATWRGLFYLVSHTRTSNMLKLRVLNVSAKDLLDDLTKAVEFDQSGLFKMIYEAEYGTYGGNPFSMLMGNYYFGRHPDDITRLEKIAEVASAGHVPFVAAADPKLFDLDSFESLAKPRELQKIFEGVELIRWRSFRQSEDSRYVSLALPQVLLRLPYHPETAPCEGVNYREDVGGRPDSSRFLWGNAAFILTERITNAFALYGWTAAIRGVEGGGLVEGLPIYTYRSDDGDLAMICPTQVAITDRREKELNDLGFISLCHCKGTNKAAFFGGQSTNQPKKYMTDAANSNAAVSAMLPYMLAASRFAHYVKVIMREKVGSFMTRSNVEAFLNTWIAQYVLLDENAAQVVKASYPLSAAKILVTDAPGKPGSYNATLFLRPHFQLEELTTSIRLVAQLPG